MRGWERKGLNRKITEGFRGDNDNAEGQEGGQRRRKGGGEGGTEVGRKQGRKEGLARGYHTTLPRVLLCLCVADVFIPVFQ